MVDAESFLQVLQGEGTYREFLLERAGRWGSRPKQPFERCVAHLIQMIITRVRRAAGKADGDGAGETSNAGSSNAPTGPPSLTRRQVEKWAKQDIKAYAKFAKRR